MSQHVFQFDGPPSAAPTTIGAHWIDTLNDKEYRSMGTATVADWVEQNTGGGGGGGGVNLPGIGLSVSVPYNWFTNSWKPLGAATLSGSTYMGGLNPDLFPIVVAAPLDLWQIQCAATGPVSGKKQRLALYDSDPTTGMPLNKIVEGEAVMSGGSDASITLAPVIPIAAGVYWVAIWQTGGGFAVQSYSSADAYFFGSQNCFYHSVSIPDGTPLPATINPANLNDSAYNPVPKLTLAS